eukprot:TsM_000593300 transcript=TsM_000593300 gene=TsM_000593300
MKSIIAVLIFAACCSGTTTPTLWGSRVVTKTSGRSDAMNYECDGEFMTIIERASGVSMLTIKDDKCLVDGDQVWGSPCRKDGNKASITVNNVLDQKILMMINAPPKTGIASTTFFVPECKFAQPAAGEVDVGTSFPLSRFVQDMDSFSVDFAVGGADVQCSWWGTKLTRGEREFCGELEKDLDKNLRVFHGNFSKKTNANRESFAFHGSSTYLVVSVDHLQSGTAEVSSFIIPTT